MFSKFSVKRPLTVIVCVIVVIVMGVISFTRMPTDLLPSMDLPYVAVITTYPGASPEKVELSVTKPLEQTLSTASGIENVTSTSSENMSMVILEFAQGTNMDSAMIELSSKIDLVKGGFDDMVSSPSLMKINPDLLPLFVASVDIDGKDIIETSRFVESDIIPALERVDGVASISPQGLIEKQLRVTLDQEKIDALNEKVLASVDSELADARKKLNEARAELEAQKRKLQDSDAGGQLADAGIAIADGKAQLQAGLDKITAAESELPAKIQELEQQRELLKKLMDAGYDTREQLGSAIKQSQEEYDTLTLQLNDSDTKVAGLQAQLAELQKQLEGLLGGGGLPGGGTGSGTTPGGASSGAGSSSDTAAGTSSGNGGGVLPPPVQELADRIAELSAQLAGEVANNAQLRLRQQALDAQMQLLDAGNSAIGDVFTGITAETGATFPEMIQQIDDGIAQIKEAQKELPAQKEELQKQLEELTGKQSEVESGKLTMSQTVGQASAQLALAEQQLAEQEAQFESAQEEAFKKANLNGMITQTMISNILAGENFSMPAGYLTEDGEQYSVKVGDAFRTADELKDLVLFTVDAEGVGQIRLTDVASVEYTDNRGEMYAKINGNEGILLSFQKQSTASTAEVSARIRETIARLEAENPGMHITALSDQGVYIDIVLNSVLQNLLMGGILAIVVLFLFLRRLKPTLIVAASIPISLLFAVALMYFSGVTMNVISLAGLALGIGMLVDNSIVVIENIYRMRAQGIPLKKAAIKGASQVAGAIFASTLTTVCVFLPIVFTEGMAKDLFKDMGLTIAFSLLASLAIALTLVPALADRAPGAQEIKEVKWFGRFQSWYGRLVGKALSHRAVVLGAAVLLLGVSVFGAARMGTAFMPTTDESQISVTMETPPDSTTEQTRAMSDEVIEVISALPDVETVGAMQSGTGNSVSLYVLLKDDRAASSQEIALQITKATEDLPCTVSAAGGQSGLMSMAGSGLEIEVRGPDLDELQRISGELAELVQNTEGTQNVSDGTEDNAAETHIVVNKNKALEYGLTVAQVYQDLAAAIKNEQTATTLTMDNTDYPVIVAKDAANNLTRAGLSDHLLKGTKNGEEVEIALKEIAEISEAEGLSSIRHDAQTRYIKVSAEIAEGYNIGLVSRDLQKSLDGYELPEGYTAKITGENENINEILGQLINLVLLAVVLIYLIMVAQFQSLLSPFIVMFTIPLAFTGGLLLLWLTGFDLSAVAMLGFLVLAGVVVNNGIVFVDYANQLKEEGMSQREALVETGRTRLRPILMTALTTILGLLTLAFGMGEGSDMLQPMAVVTIGGLSYATLLTLFVVPCLYDVFHRKDRKKEAAAGSGEPGEPAGVLPEAEAAGTGEAPGAEPEPLPEPEE